MLKLHNILSRDEFELILQSAVWVIWQSFVFPKLSLYGKLQAKDFCNVPKRLWRIDVPHWYSYRSLSFLSQLDENKTQVRIQNGTHG